MKLYHGTQAEFVKFDPKFSGMGNCQDGAGFYLTDQRNGAWQYAKKTNGVGFI
jgi:predicted nucleic acid-binding Zn ribbon protein